MIDDAQIDPPVPADMTFADFKSMPFEGERAFKSDSWINASPEGKVAMLRLWWGAFRQEPSGSLPDNDRVLAEIAGYGVAIEAWRQIRAEAMRGFRKATDGRLYHMFLCEMLLELWEDKRKKVADRAADRQRKQRLRAKGLDDAATGNAASRGATPGNAASPSGGRPADNPPDKTPLSAGQRPISGGVSGGIPPEKALKGSEEKGENPQQHRVLDSARDPLSGGRPADSTPDTTDEGLLLSRCRALIQAALDVIGEVYGAEHRPPFPAGSDITRVRPWIELGATPDMVRAIAVPVLQKRKAAGEPPPRRAVAYLDVAILETLRQRPAPAIETAPVDDGDGSTRRYTEAVQAWSRGGREGPAPKRADFGLA